MLNEFIQSVFSPKQKLRITTIKRENPILTNFDLSKQTIQKTVDQTDVTRTRLFIGLPPAFFQKISRNVSKKQNKLFKNIKRLWKIQDSWRDSGSYTNSH